MNATSDAAAVDGVRADLWLWAARFFKTRALAKAAIVAGKVAVGGQVIKPSRLIRIDDVVDLMRAGERWRLTVAALADRRRSAPLAQALYVEDPDVAAQRAAQRALDRDAARGYQAPQGKPDKRARRLIRALGDLDAT